MKILGAVVVVVWLLWSGGNHAYAVGAAVLGLVVWALDVAIFPTVKCGWCEHGRQHSPLGKGFRACGSCGGAGVRPKWGHRMVGRGK